jgi:hypothetical protein
VQACPLCSSLPADAARRESGVASLQGSAKDSETVDFEDEIHEPSIAAQGPVTHLLLVVHGVGQKMESASIVRETKKLRRAVQLGSLRISREARGGRVEVLPIQWRKHLTLKTDEHLEGLRANCTPLPVYPCSSALVCIPASASVFLCIAAPRASPSVGRGCFARAF